MGRDTFHFTHHPISGCYLYLKVQRFWSVFFKDAYKLTYDKQIIKMKQKNGLNSSNWLIEKRIDSENVYSQFFRQPKEFSRDKKAGQYQCVRTLIIHICYAIAFFYRCQQIPCRGLEVMQFQSFKDIFGRRKSNLVKWDFIKFHLIVDHRHKYYHRRRHHYHHYRVEQSSKIVNFFWKVIFP